LKFAKIIATLFPTGEDYKQKNRAAAAEAIAREQPQQQTEAIVATVCFRALSCMEPEKQQPSVKRLFS